MNSALSNSSDECVACLHRALDGAVFFLCFAISGEEMVSAFSYLGSGEGYVHAKWAEVVADK
jgi:hypothetical protein